ncbi:HAD-IIIC family phosphatase [Kitasatospora sp. NPDC056446]|uniref:HAD-IIIC family phosphatase n=1 Tax=Kitasatospora sp. NPDC056446 TaxID=3345819 RepID=UPI0036AB3ACC
MRTNLPHQRTDGPAPVGRPWPELLEDLRGRLDPALWREAARRLRADQGARRAHGRRQVRLTVLATHTADFLADLLPAAGLSCGIDLTVHQPPYGLPESQLAGPASGLRAARPDYVLLSGTEHDLQLSAAAPDDVVAAAVERWTGLWERIRAGTGARVVQCLFTAPDNDPHGQGTPVEPGGDSEVVARVNAELVRRADREVLLVDCDRLAAAAGRSVWHDPRHWHVLRQPVAPAALPLLARALAGVLAADLALTRRVVVVDLDNTLWGGVLGEDGPYGVALAQGPDGEAFAGFQEYLRQLRRRGIALAVASKNDRDLVERALAEVPGMRLRRSDFAAVVADWRPKSEQLLDIAARLRLGPEHLAFVDDNPVERAEVRAHLPEVDVIELPDRPALFRRALAGRPTLQPGRTTDADLSRTASLDALAAADSLRVASSSPEQFLDSLAMRATVRRPAAEDLDRAAQLLQKTNQFNLTSRRHSRDRLARLAADPDWTCLLLSLSDRFADHGTVGLLLLHRTGADAEIDTLVLSCRVIGRTAERRLLHTAAEAARAAGCVRLLGLHVPTGRNGLVRDLYPGLGFESCPGPAPRSEGDGEDERPVLYSYAYRLGPGRSLDTPHIRQESA